MFAAGFAEALTNGQLYFAGRRSSLRIRSILVEEIYQKAMRRSAVIKPSIAGPTNQLSSSSSTSDASTKLSEPDEGAASLGKIVTLMSVDAERLREFVSYAHRLVLETPISVGLALSGLFFVLGWSAVVGVLMLLLGTVLGACAGSKIGKVQEQVMTNTDKRVNITNEVLQGIRIIKYLAWESQFMKRILEARKTELAALKRLWLAYIGFNFTATLSSLLVAFATFACYTTVAGHTLDSQTAFTAIALLQQISVLIAYLPWQITEVFQAKVSLERINKFLREPELEKYSDTAAAGDKREFLPVIGFRNASFTYYVEELVAGDVPTLATDTGHAPAVVPATAFVLRDIDQEFPIGGLSVVCGPTGAGKSSLLLSLLGEMKRLSGFHNFPDTRNLRDVVTAEPSTGVAFASQTPWLLNATIRDNILFGNPYDAERYQRVVKACALLRDLETLDGGDLTEIGEKGVNMSGGQKARISLARAAYSPASTVLLDDPLSAVDAATAKHLLHDCILGLMRNRTRILVSHAVGLVLPHADLVIGIQNGQVIATGEAEEVARSMDLNGLPGVRFGDNEPNEGVPHGEAEVSQAAAALPGTGTKLVEAEERAVGRVPLSIYWSYFAACGGAVFIIVYLAILLLVNAAQLADDWWIKQWSDAYMTGSDLVGKLISRRSTVVEFFPELLGQTLWDGTFLANDAKLPVGGTTMTNIRSLVWLNAKWAFSLGSNSTLAHNIWYYIGIYGALGASVLLANLLRVGYILLRSTTAARNLHATLLKRVLGAPLRFFEVTPLGRILNRFSKDVQSIDTTMVQSIDMFAVQVTKGITIIGLIAYVGPSFVLGALPIVFIYWYVANQYLQASRELKRLESLSRSPIYSQFSETLTGVTTIRAYGAEERFLRQAREKVDGNHRAYFLLWAANRWLTVRTDLLGAFVALATGIVVVEGNLDPGWAGLALTYALSFSDALLWIVRQHAEVEMNMNSVERINDYISIEQEAPAIIQGHRPPSSWPGEGRIEVTDLCVKYSDDQPVVLKNISFSVRAREKIGVVGRTGAGKSTLSLAFFRILPITGGTIIIDGIDIMTIGLQDLRSQINIIPQDPVLFSGTLRSNMDPFDEYDDAEIWSALRSAHVVESLNHGRSGSDMTITGELGGRLVVDNHIGSNNGATSLAPPDPSFTLDYPVAENGSNFSQGQRQLLCLARALLRRTRVVFLDEATASVDNETDAKIQATIRECFVDATVLCVAHRLRTVMDYDRILVLDHGNVVEFGTPLQLLEQREALGDHFRRMVAETGEFEDLLEVARQAGKKRARQEH
ncbi:hypothetical protein HK104_005738 [Borealophlyctis nickersoniae]|nr:hypothetical protein HK104_005738 [Borealophlyctis nickersoniae]